jgi:hypothetical protein
MPYEVSVDATVARGSEELMKTHAVLAAVLLMLGSAPATATVRIANDTGGQIGPYLAKYSGVEGLGRTRRNRWHLRVGMHHAAGNHSAKPHLHHAARQPRISQRLGHGGRSSGHLRGQPHPVVDLSRKRAPVDQIARRAAF